ncbi:MAG: C40 family peptidase [Deltaproteobacteria bacterium]|jgi:cell wall-associated NlpC family hydrolase|nr:C40 family peptidase [Deltaproteobacteria bacterium]
MRFLLSLPLIIILILSVAITAGCGGKHRRASPLASQVVNTAHKYIGVPYVYGGKSPKGFDCSGLVWYVYRQHGVELPASSRKQAGTGLKVDKSEMQPGDLVFFQNNGRVDHVGLYIGDDFMIHAPGRGKKVTKANLKQNYYRKHFAHVRRVI